MANKEKDSKLKVEKKTGGSLFWGGQLAGASLFFFLNQLPINFVCGSWVNNKKINGNKKHIENHSM